jgi:peptide/nickel transport system substrate-binding protein
MAGAEAATAALGATRGPGRARWRRRLLVAALLCVGCGAFRHPRTITVGFDRVPGTLDPQHHNELVGWSLLCNFYDALVRFSPEMKIQPSLATSWVQLDPTHVRFTLRRGVRFSNGEPFTAADVAATFERGLRDPQSKIRHHLVGITHVTAESDTSLLIETSAPAPTLVNRLAFLFVIPRSQTGQAEITNPIGTGPYRLVRREPDGSLLAEAWRSWWGKPAISRVRFRFLEDERTRTEVFAGGTLDVADDLAYNRIAELQTRPGLRVRSQPSLVVQLLVINPGAASGQARRALADLRVRRAMLLAIDRQGLVDRAQRGNGAVATQYVHPVVFGFDPSLAPAPFDPEEARRLLAAAGFAGGFRVDFAHGSVPPAYVAEIVQDLGRIGIRLHPVQFSLRELLQRAQAHEFALATYGRACTTADASEFLDSSIHSLDEARGLGLEDFSSYHDAETDALLEAADSELDRGRRLALLQQAQRRVLDQLPILPLTLRSEFLGTRSRVDVPARYDGWLWVAGFTFER